MQRRLLNAWRFFGDVWTIDQFNESHRCVVADAETHFQDAQVAAVTSSVAWAQFGEQLADDFTVAQAGECQTLVSQCIGLAQSQDRLDYVAQQGYCHVAQHCQAVRGSTIQFTETVTVTHDISFQITVLIQLFYRQCLVAADRYRLGYCLLPGLVASTTVLLDSLLTCFVWRAISQPLAIIAKITFPGRLVANFPASCPGSDRGMPELP